MKLLTAEIKDRLRKHPLSDNCSLDDEVIVKFFGGSAATWLITEAEEQADGDWLFFGLATIGLPSQRYGQGKLLWEWGYVTLRQLEEVRFPPFELPAERDMWLPKGTKVRDEVFMFEGAE